MKKTLLCFLAGCFLLTASAQERNFWTSVNESSITKNVFAGRYKPLSYRLFQLRETNLFTELGGTPSERTTAASGSSFILSVPVAEGRMERFKIVEAPVLHEALAARYPGIRSFAGQGLDNPASTIRFDISPEGFHAMILSPEKPAVFIDPVDRDEKFYVVFSKTGSAANQEPFSCLTDEAAASIVQDPAPSLRNADDARLRTYRLALAATGEYSAYFLNGTETTDAQRKTKVLAAMNTAMTRTNAIYERDFGIRMILIANNDAIIYLNASSDPWTSEFNSKTQQTIDAVIGSANYDIGHLVHRAGNNGNAGCIGCVCKAGQKGSAFTSHTVPLGDPFVVDYLAHEMGHQFGGNHTFSHSYEGTIAQCEPGSGSTIMGYAGITGATTDIQSNSDDYFHARTIEQITNYIKSATGGACAQVGLTGNSTPVASAGADYTIPKSTPFTLTGTGSDADAGDVLTYVWEQVDARTSSSPTTPAATATAGAVFRSYAPGANPSRTFPRLSSILDGTNGYKWEVLPSVARTLTFRFTVKDNKPGGANNKSDDMLVSVSGAAGPFAVSSPNTAVTWAAGSAQTVSWSVNGTNAAPVSCANVAILLSTDGGLSFPITLVASTPNDGSQAITVPSNLSSQCRIKVAALGNIFFDISNTNFTIDGTAPSCTSPASLTSSAVTSSGAGLAWTSVTGALSYDIDYKTAASAVWTNAATGTTALSVSITWLTPSTAYDWRVRTNCASGSSSYASAQFTTAAATGGCTSAYEANETLSAAAEIPVNTSVSAAIGSATDRDWYRFTLASASNLNISLTNLPGDYDIIFYNSAGTEIRRSENAGTANESITNANTAAGSYYVQVLGYNGANSTTVCYALNIGSTAVTTGCSSSYDNATNGAVSGAALIPLNTDIKGLIGASGDNDYYRFTLSTAGTVTISLSTLPADYDIRLYNSSGTTQVGISQNGGTTSEAISYSAAAGTYYVRVYGYNNASNGTQCYTLRVASGTASRGDDYLVGSKKAASLYPNPAANSVTLRLPGNREKAEIDIVDMNGRVVLRQLAFSDISRLDIAALAKGVYAVSVRKADGETVHLRLVKE